MKQKLLIAGGGIGGLATALACARAGAQVRLIERSEQFAEVGAGIQMGPNVMRRLQSWGLQAALDEVIALPERLLARDALSGRVLGELPLGERALQRYAAPYASVHRADLQQLLLAAVRQQPEVRLTLNCCVSNFTQDAQSITLRTAEGLNLQADALIGADGLWSRVRQCLLGDEAPRVTGHLAYRAVIPQRQLPEKLRSQVVTAWLGPRLHVVQYPVRRGEWLNVVAVVQGRLGTPETQSWNHEAHAADLRAVLATTRAAAPLQELVGSIEEWRMWALCDRPPMRGAHEQAQGRVALLGDAAHPMRPYLAQGAGMAIEDAAELERLLGSGSTDMPALLQQYARNRWQRNARVQARSIRNGQIYHAQGPMRWGRNLALGALGPRIMDQPWLYQY
jgi:salicylate hydroxylase